MEVNKSQNYWEEKISEEDTSPADLEASFIKSETDIFAVVELKSLMLCRMWPGLIKLAP